MIPAFETGSSHEDEHGVPEILSAISNGGGYLAVSEYFETHFSQSEKDTVHNLSMYLSLLYRRPGLSSKDAYDESLSLTEAHEAGFILGHAMFASDLTDRQRNELWDLFDFLTEASSSSHRNQHADLAKDIVESSISQADHSLASLPSREKLPIQQLSSAMSANGREYRSLLRGYLLTKGMVQKSIENTREPEVYDLTKNGFIQRALETFNKSSTYVDDPFTTTKNINYDNGVRQLNQSAEILAEVTGKELALVGGSKYLIHDVRKNSPGGTFHSVPDNAILTGTFNNFFTAEIPSEQEMTETTEPTSLSAYNNYVFNGLYLRIRGASLNFMNGQSWTFEADKHIYIPLNYSGQQLFAKDRDDDILKLT